MYKGIIFDMDGTMVDNMMIHHRAWKKTLSKMGLEMSLDEVKEKIHGVNEEILLRVFGAKYSAEERKKYAWEKEAMYREIYLPELKLINGLQELLDEARSKNIPMAIGTAAPPENADFVVDNLNLRHYFKGFFHAGHVSKGKPDPEIFEIAAASMNLPLSECLIFEDSVTGAEAAKRADSKAVIVTTTHTQEEFSHFDHVVEFIDDYSTFELASYFSSSYK